MLTKEEKNELRKFSKSAQLRDDMRAVSKTRHDSLLINQVIDIDRLVTFLTDYNRFISHQPRLFRKIIDSHMIL